MLAKSVRSKKFLVRKGYRVPLLAISLLLSHTQASISSAAEESDAPAFAGSALQERLNSGEYAAVMVIDGNQEMSIYAAGGENITGQHCGKLKEDGSIEENMKVPADKRCNLKDINLLKWDTVSILTIEKNPRCTLMRRGPYLWLVHAGGDNYPYGAYPCHDGPH